MNIKNYKSLSIIKEISALKGLERKDRFWQRMKGGGVIFTGFGKLIGSVELQTKETYLKSRKGRWHILFIIKIYKIIFF